jgi:hypothetical protein
MSGAPAGGISYRDAAVALWGEAGAYAHDTYRRLRQQLYPELPESLPIVIGITAYGHCRGQTSPGWSHGPRITLASREFISEGLRAVDDLLRHEMLHAWLFVTDRRDDESHGKAWYEQVRKLSPAVLGRDLDVWRGRDRKSVRVPNPGYEPGVDDRKTLVRKVRVESADEHGKVARWPHSFRPPGYDWGPVMPACPSY